ncbi:uncharacterized protein H6S33_006516 [Morchella sextelata]|uniref:uncharacterized protein n=1 Tax=Morchella sextelata TaxID=1174677 RepID=UPI001D0394CD|nr:uncharacterized protein H6S33_006516 [Morchella sextelata]KAH0604848.1 hypothetical protein H6S33_006516 [Morchella sextelata]
MHMPYKVLQRAEWEKPIIPLVLPKLPDGWTYALVPVDLEDTFQQLFWCYTCVYGYKGQGGKTERHSRERMKKQLKLEGGASKKGVSKKVVRKAGASKRGEPKDGELKEGAPEDGAEKGGASEKIESKELGRLFCRIQ